MMNKLVFSCSLVLLISSCAAFDVGKILSHYPDYSKFNDLLNQTGLYKDINSRQTITILVVPNDAMGDLAGRPVDVIRRILSTHIMLDYFDVPKIAQMSTKSTMVTNLYQSSGIANNFQGFLNITSTADKKIGFGSAVKGSPIDVKLQKLVVSQPYNVSVLQVSGLIYTPGIDGTLAAPPRKSITPSAAPPAPVKKNDTSSSPAPSSSDSEGSDAPVPSTPADAPTNAAPAPSPKAADGPNADEVPADASPPTKSSGMSLRSGFMSSFVVALLSSLAYF